MDSNYKIPISSLKDRGVYILYDNDEIVYVGKSINVYGRITQHKLDKVFTHYSILPIEDESEMCALEVKLIIEHKPKYNTVYLAKFRKKKRVVKPYIRTELDHKIDKIRQEMCTEINAEYRNNNVFLPDTTHST